MARTTVQEDDRADTEERPIQERAMDAVRAAPDTVRQAAGVVAERAPEALSASQDAIRASQDAINEASRRLQSGSPQELTTWAAFGMGLWIGLLLGRAPRLLVLAAGLPALVLGGALLARRDAPELDTDS
jgi:hypothetical protein